METGSARVTRWNVVVLDGRRMGMVAASVIVRSTRIGGRVDGRLVFISMRRLLAVVVVVGHHYGSSLTPAHVFVFVLVVLIWTIPNG